MKLREILIDSDKLGEYDVVYAKRPWSLESDACVVRYEANEAVTRLLKDDTSLEYFLEAELIKDIRSQVEDSGKSSVQVLDILLYYAENDAFP
jgi:hypothetical protein